jgi:hypothetical protein
MRVPPIIFAFACIALGSLADIARADVFDDARAAIELTDRRIEQAEMLVASSDLPLAQDELRRAVEVQAHARVELAAGHPRVAIDLTLRARAHADRAIAAVRGLPDPERVQVQLERTRDMIERARERIEECDNDRARAMLRAALDIQGRAEVAAREGRFLAALQLTMSARERTLRALRLCNLGENQRENAERALQRTDDAIERAREAVQRRDQEQGRRALARAVDLQARAHADFRAGRFEASVRLTLDARAIALRLTRVAAGG